MGVHTTVVNTISSDGRDNWTIRLCLLDHQVKIKAECRYFACKTGSRTVKNSTQNAPNLTIFELENQTIYGDGETSSPQTLPSLERGTPPQTPPLGALTLVALALGPRTSCSIIRSLVDDDNVRLQSNCNATQQMSYPAEIAVDTTINDSFKLYTFVSL